MSESVKVFISYNHRDAKFVNSLKRKLQSKKIDVTIDVEAVKFGDNLQEFIEKSVRLTDFTICVISRNSLHSVWVIAEALETLMYEKVSGKKKFLPIFIDPCFLAHNFQAELVEATEKSIDMIREEINTLSQKYLPTTALDLEKTRLIELRHNIDKILKKLREILVADFSSKAKIQENFPKLVDLIRQQAASPSTQAEDAAPPDKPEPTPFLQFVNRKIEWERVVLYPKIPYFLFDGPAGYGKTALLHEIEKQFTIRGWRCCYVSLQDYATFPAIGQYLAQQLQLTFPVHDAKPRLTGVEIGTALAAQQAQKQFEGIVLLFDVDQEPWEPRIKTLELLVEEVIPGIFEALAKHSDYFKNTPSGFRVVLAGRYLASLIEKFSYTYKFDTIQLTPFHYEVALDTCKDNIADLPVRQEFAAHLLFYSGGHPRCMARMLKTFQASGASPVTFFETYQAQITQIAYQEAFWVRESMARDWRIVFDALCLYRRFDYQLLNQLLQKYPEWKSLAEDGYDLGMKLKQSYLINWADAYRKHLRDDITRRLLAIRLVHDLPDAIFQAACEEARQFCAERLKTADFDRAYWAIETLFEYLQARIIKVDVPAERQKLRQTFMTQELPRVLEILVQDRDPRPEKDGLLGILENDWEFRFTLNYVLRQEGYSEVPYQHMLDRVEQFLTQPSVGGDK